MKKIYYSQSEALEAALELKKENPNYTVLSGKSLDLSYDVEQSDSFSELVKDWAGEVSAYKVLDERGQIVATIGYWDTESVELARARRDVKGAIANWGDGVFTVDDDDSADEIAQFITRIEVEESILREGDLYDGHWASLLGELDLKVGDISIIHVFNTRDDYRDDYEYRRLVLCYAQDF